MNARRFPRLAYSDAWLWGPLVIMFGGVVCLSLWANGWHTRGALLVLGLFGFCFVSIVADMYRKWVAFVVSEGGIAVIRWGKVVTEVPWQEYAGWRWLRVSEDKSGDDAAVGFGVRDAPRAIVILRRSGAPPLEIRFGYCGLAGTLRDGLVVPARRYREFLDVLRAAQPSPAPGWSETAGYPESRVAPA